MVPLQVVCILLGVHLNTGYDWARKGEFPIPVRKNGGRWYCLDSDVEDYFGPGCL